MADKLKTKETESKEKAKDTDKSSQFTYKQAEKVNFIRNTKIYLNFIKKYRGMYLFIFLTIIVIQLASLAERYLFKIVIDRGTEFASGTFAKEAFISLLVILALIYWLAVAIRAAFNWLQMQTVNKMEGSMIYDLKTKFFNHIIHLSHRFHTTHKTGSLISRLTRGGKAIERMTDFIVFNLAPLAISLTVIAVSFIYLNIASAITIIVVVLLFIVFNIIMSFVQQKANIAANNAEDREKGNIADIFMNIDSIKYFGKESTIKSKYSGLATETKNLYIKFWNYTRWFDLGQVLINAAGIFFLVYFPLRLFLNGQISIGTISFIYTSYMSIMGPLYGFIHGIRSIYESMADFQALFDYEKVQNEIKDAVNAPALKIKQGSIEFKDIEFSYHSRKIIDNLSIKIKPNEKVALVGRSGSGKTTLVKLLYRFYDVHNGKIMVDGRNIKDLKQESLRSELSIVPQECILFDDSIYNNIAFSDPSASKSEVFNAIKFSQLDKFIASLPQKENTIVGERGVKLSGGEKQRVSIARAILANKKILVLDEATSSLDSETEHEIQNALSNLMKGRTSIIIAHRLSTIMSADKIVLLDKGRVIQTGTHNELIRKPGIYKKLWGLQKGGYIGQ